MRMRDMGCHGGRKKIYESKRWRNMRAIEAEEKLEAVRGRWQIMEVRRIGDVRS
jgi:hypothetical protein